MATDQETQNSKAWTAILPCELRLAGVTTREGDGSARFAVTTLSLAGLVEVSTSNVSTSNSSPSSASSDIPKTPESSIPHHSFMPGIVDSPDLANDSQDVGAHQASRAVGKSKPNDRALLPAFEGHSQGWSQEQSEPHTPVTAVRDSPEHDLDAAIPTENALVSVVAPSPTAVTILISAYDRVVDGGRKAFVPIYQMFSDACSFIVSVYSAVAHDIWVIKVIHIQPRLYYKKLVTAERDVNRIITNTNKYMSMSRPDYVALIGNHGVDNLEDYFEGAKHYIDTYEWHHRGFIKHPRAPASKTLAMLVRIKSRTKASLAVIVSSVKQTIVTAKAYTTSTLATAKITFDYLKAVAPGYLLQVAGATAELLIWCLIVSQLSAILLLLANMFGCYDPRSLLINITLLILDAGRWSVLGYLEMFLRMAYPHPESAARALHLFLKYDH